MRELRANLGALGREPCVMAAGDGPLWQDEAVIALTDRMIVTVFRSPEAGGPAVSPASAEWIHGLTLESAARLGPDRAIMAVG